MVQVNRTRMNYLEKFQRKLVLDWRKRQPSKAEIEITIKDILDKLPRRYTLEIHKQKCQEIYQHIYESYSGVEQSIY